MYWTTFCLSRQKHKHACKRPFVCWCDCLTQSSWWILFNANWQQLNSLAPFGGPLLLVFLLPLTSGPTSRLSLLCYMPDLGFFFYYYQKGFCPSFRKGKSISSLCLMETKWLFSLCLCMHVCKVLKCQLLPSVRREKVSIHCAQFTQSSALKSRAFTEWQIVVLYSLPYQPTNASFMTSVY